MSLSKLIQDSEDHEGYLVSTVILERALPQMLPGNTDRVRKFYYNKSNFLQYSIPGNLP
jgi:hypothetical protein